MRINESYNQALKDNLVYHIKNRWLYRYGFYPTEQEVDVELTMMGFPYQIMKEEEDETY